MESRPLDRRLAALKAELAGLRPPVSVDRALAAAIARAERRTSAPARVLARRLFKLSDRWLPAGLALAASLPIIVWTLRAPPTQPTRPLPERPLAASPAATEFIPVVPVADIARTRGAYVVSTQMPRTMLADFGLPVNPARAAEPVDSELLVRADGTVLAVRFLE
ncbi:MAG TPA: hypothetical protein VMN79_18995 [Casimicrobiaceae bacterium]|nr:hypothetical protein [Casimicrobiaceae bacterium]